MDRAAVLKRFLMSLLKCQSMRLAEFLGFGQCGLGSEHQKQWLWICPIEVLIPGLAVQLRVGRLSFSRRTRDEDLVQHVLPLAATALEELRAQVNRRKTPLAVENCDDTMLVLVDVELASLLGMCQWIDFVGYIHPDVSACERGLSQAWSLAEQCAVLSQFQERSPNELAPLDPQQEVSQLSTDPLPARSTRMRQQGSLPFPRSTHRRARVASQCVLR